jgi:phytoene/squalene synthetase
MSDTANTPNLASIDDLDARLKRTDEDRWLATRYAPAGSRERLVAIYLLNQELQRALHAKEAMLGKIRLQWWRETLAQLTGTVPLRRHDLAEQLARVLNGRPDLLKPMNELVDAYDNVLDDHLQAGGHQASGAHEERHFAVEGALMQLSGLTLAPDAERAGIEALTAAGAARVALAAGLEGADLRWKAAKAGLRQVPATLWPAALHLAAASADGQLGKRWRIFRAALCGRL